jgi:hypothetical protein
MAETISFSVAGNGWNSFHSYIPDWMIGMDSSLYTWKDGDLYLHDDNAIRNNYYGVNYSSTITPIFNQEPTKVKMFKTLALEGDSRWQADIDTDMSTGIIEIDYYKEKEGDFYAYIRRDPDTIDTYAMSTQGIGEVLSYDAPTVTITFGFNIAASIAELDKVYLSDGSTLTEMGTIASHTATTITFQSSPFVVPVAGNFIVVVKDSTAESFGARGYYAQVKLTNSETTPVELFSISSEAFESKG